MIHRRSETLPAHRRIAAILPRRKARWPRAAVPGLRLVLVVPPLGLVALGLVALGPAKAACARGMEARLARGARVAIARGARVAAARGARVSPLAPPQDSQSPEPISDEEVRALVSMADRVEKEVEELRGWHFKTPVAKGVYTEEQLRGFLLEQLDKEWGGGKVERLSASYRLAGVLPPGVPFAQTFVDLLMNQVGGFYDHEKKAFFMLKRKGVEYPEALNRMLVAHELTHALDDQVVDIGAMMSDKDLTSDEEAAVGAVIEGSATVLMTRYSTRLLASGELDLAALMKVQAAEMERGKPFFEAPPIFTTILANYLAGQAFFLAGRGFTGKAGGDKSSGDEPRGDGGAVAGGGGSERADGNASGEDAGGENPLAGMMEDAMPSVGYLVKLAAADLPRSSEQILHPEKYWSTEDRDDPITIDDTSVEAALEKTDAPEVLYRDTLGELLAAIATREEGWAVSLLAASMSGEAWTHYPAEGWGGDRFYLLGTDAALEDAVRAEKEWAGRKAAGGDGSEGGQAVPDPSSAPPPPGPASTGLRGLWVTVWDTGQDRDEFADAYAGRQGLPGFATLRPGKRTAIFLLGFSEAEAAPIREVLLAHPPALARNGKPETP